MSSTEFQVTVRNTGGGSAGIPRGEWICLQSEFCSYAPATVVGDAATYPVSEFDDYNAFAQSTATRSLAVLKDGSAKYGQPVCPTSNCEAVIFYDNYMSNGRATCPFHTEMALTLTGLEGDWDRCAAPPAGVEISGDLPDGCNLVEGEYCCPAGGPYTLKFVHSTASCQPSQEDGLPCSFPLTGRAYGSCGASEVCVRNLEAAEVEVTQAQIPPTNEPSSPPIATALPTSESTSPPLVPAPTDAPSAKINADIDTGNKNPFVACTNSTNIDISVICNCPVCNCPVCNCPGTENAQLGASSAAKHQFLAGGQGLLVTGLLTAAWFARKVWCASGSL